MAAETPTNHNRYKNTQSTTAGTNSWAGYYPLSPSGERTTRRADQRAVINYLSKNGTSNPPFEVSTGGRITPVQTIGGSSEPRITRGFIRRAAPDSTDPLSTTSLNFMYNPESIVRDYVSYLDQAALDPFNTLYDSGNLVAPPSFINFSFDLLFDRQIEQDSKGQSYYLPEGVLADYRYFDMVVRNVPPVDSNGNTTTPDNGVMMVNPKDITVVFSPELTVQGRPINARVAFTKFAHNMIPTRMSVSLTMIITYFGPLRQAFALDTFQDIREYEALIPYSAVYDETYTRAELEAAQKVWNEQNDSRIAESAKAEKALPYSTIAYNQAIESAISQAGGAAEQNGQFNVELRGQALKQAQFRVAASAAKNGVCRYDPINAVGVDTYSDAGLVWVSYADLGVQDKVNGKKIDFTPTLSGIISYQQSSNWTHLSKLIPSLGAGAESILQSKIEAGDLLVSEGASSHIAFFVKWNDSSKTACTILHARGPGRNCGEDALTVESVAATYSYVLRPTMVGSLSSGNGFQAAGTGGPTTGNSKLSNAKLRELWAPKCAGPWGRVQLHGGRITAQVRASIVDATNALNSKLVKYNYQVVESGSGAFNCRNIAGTNTPSLHSFGIAIDINPTRNPYTSSLTTDMPSAMVNEILALRTNSGAQVWNWGGNWSKRKDAMHFEIATGPADIATGLAGYV